MDSREDFYSLLLVKANAVKETKKNVLLTKKNDFRQDSCWSLDDALDSVTICWLLEDFLVKVTSLTVKTLWLYQAQNKLCVPVSLVV